MSSVEMSDTFALGDLRVRRLGFGAMHLSGPGVFGPPNDRAGALAVLREAVVSGVIVCVQNKYNLMHREDDALVDDLARDRIAYVPVSYTHLTLPTIYSV